MAHAPEGGKTPVSRGRAAGRAGAAARPGGGGGKAGAAA